jgi:hypothetical protein
MNNEILTVFLIVFLVALNLLKSYKINKLKRKINSLRLKNKWLINLKKPY